MITELTSLNNLELVLITIIIINMFEGDYELDLSEEDLIENPANIYSIVRTLEFIVKIHLYTGMGL